MGQYCTQCGTKNTDDAAFCSECGQALQDKEKSAHAKTSNVNEAAHKTDSYEQTPELNWIWALFSFNGRINRMRYWLYFLLSVAIIFPFVAIGKVIPLIGFGYAIFFSWASFALMVKRFHDLGKSGWFAIIGLIPLVYIILGFIEGTRGDNKYGIDIVNA
ncbi:MAG: DUF805 domain-containing protein [Sulfuricurvum sp.]|nr:DUF805 domain-containing protein [Sulfuricurvum sp.]MDP3022761.1 DUF805 domain-containing protein [Sulfuricurvum sp.]